MAVGKRIDVHLSPVLDQCPVHQRQPLSRPMISLEEMGIREVWNWNFTVEMHRLAYTSSCYKVIAVNIEFPGIAVQPIETFQNSAEYKFYLMHTNVHLLKVLKLGLSFFKEDGSRPSDVHTWQFNFALADEEEQDTNSFISMQLLKNYGFDLDRHERHGIPIRCFVHSFIGTGLLVNKQITWLFHSGYDISFMLQKLCIRPNENDRFFSLLLLFFPFSYDLDYLLNVTKNNIHVRLRNVICSMMSAVGQRLGAGVVSSVTGMTFFRLKEIFSNANITTFPSLGSVCGLSSSPTSFNGGPTFRGHQIFENVDPGYANFVDSIVYGAVENSVGDDNLAYANVGADDEESAVFDAIMDDIFTLFRTCYRFQEAHPLSME